MKNSEWISVNDGYPLSLMDVGRKNDIPYVLAVDSKNRMSVGYIDRLYSNGTPQWVFTKPIGKPTHWMHLPRPPVDG